MFGLKRRIIALQGQIDTLMDLIHHQSTVIKIVCREFGVDIDKHLQNLVIDEEINVVLEDTGVELIQPINEPVKLNNHNRNKTTPIVYPDMETIQEQIQFAYDYAKQKCGDSAKVDEELEYDENYRALFAQAVFMLRKIYIHETGRGFHQNTRTYGSGALTKRIFNTPVARHRGMEKTSASTVSSILNARAYTVSHGRVSRYSSVSTLQNYNAIFRDYLDNHLINGRCVDVQGDCCS